MKLRCPFYRHYLNRGFVLPLVYRGTGIRTFIFTIQLVRGFVSFIFNPTISLLFEKNLYKKVSKVADGVSNKS